MFLPASAGAAVVTYTTSAGPSMSFTAFDPSLGSLDSVNLTLKLHLDGILAVINNSGAPQAFSVTETVDAQFQGPGGGPPVFETAYTPLIDFVEPTGFTLQEVQSDVQFGLKDPHPLLADYSSSTASTVNYVAFLAPQMFPPSLPGVQFIVEGNSYGGPATLTYEYTPVSAASVPEPASWALMLLGIGGVGAALRRRHKLSAGAA